MVVLPVFDVGTGRTVALWHC